MPRVRPKSKVEWAKANGASRKAKRLHLRPTHDGYYLCPVDECDHDGFCTQRGCRKHVFTRHGWFYFFDVKPNMIDAFPEMVTRNTTYTTQKRCNTVLMPSFNKECKFAVNFIKWLESDGGGAKNSTQSHQIGMRVLKWLKFCCQDADEKWDIPLTVVDYCIGSVEMLGEFFEYLKENWKMASAGCIGYLNALSHVIDYRKMSGLTENLQKALIVTEVYLSRIRRTIAKRMRLEWTTMLDLDYLESQGCWATYEEMKNVMPFHTKRYMDIQKRSEIEECNVPSHDLSFATAYIASLLFLEVKASRPMTYQYLTVGMVKAINADGLIDQTAFKTREKYCFDSLVFTPDIIALVNGYIDYVRPRLNPKCDFVLITRCGKQQSKLSSLLGKIVYEAIGKYIHPTRYRQIIETTSATSLSPEEQEIISEDQKHSSRVAKIHYKKLRSRDIAIKARRCMDKIHSSQKNESTIIDQQPQLREIHTPGKKPKEEECIETSNDCQITKVTARLPKLTFTQQEDLCLKKGVKKYGWGSWTAILNDPDYVFHRNRRTNTLERRAKIVCNKKV